MSIAPIIPIELDKQRNLKYTGKAFRLIEQQTGKNALTGEIWQEMNMGILATVLWAGLAHEDKDLTLDDVDELLHPGNQMYVMEQIHKAWTEAIEVPGEADPLAQDLPKK